MNRRGDVLALGAVAALAALGLYRSGAIPAAAPISGRRLSGGQNIQVPLASLERPTSADIAEMVIVGYSPTDFVRVFPDHARMMGRSVEVFTKDRGLVEIEP
jgi:hypothetical protein